MANREYLSTQAGSIKREHAAITSTGATDANLLVALNADGHIDASMLPADVMRVSVYDVDQNGVVDQVPWTGIDGRPTSTTTQIDAAVGRAHEHINGTVLDATTEAFTTALKSEYDALATSKQDVLGFTPEDASKKGQSNGYASLDGTGKVPTSQLPSNFATNCTIVATIAERDALTSVKVADRVLVKDATGDTSVTSGWAEYVYDENSQWFKMSEGESMDLILDWSNVQNKPTSTTADIDQAVADSHTHNNNAVLAATDASFTTTLQTTYDGYAASKQDKLTYTPEDASKKGQADGYASLGADGTVPASQLPENVCYGRRVSETFIVDSAMLSAKQLTLGESAHSLLVQATMLSIHDGINQTYTEDFVVSGTTLSWDGLGLQSLLQVGDKITVLYWTGSPVPLNPNINAADLAEHSAASDPHSAAGYITQTVADGRYEPINAVSTHASNNDLHVTATLKGAMTSAASPSSSNPFATVADITAATPSATGWVNVPTFTRVSDTSFTVTHNADNEALFMPRTALRYRSSGGAWFYGVVDSYSSGTVTLLGAAFSASYTELSADATGSKTTVFHLLAPGDFASAASSTILLTSGKTYESWDLRRSAIVSFKARVATDYGTTAPTINMAVNGNVVGSAAVSAVAASWTRVAGVSTSNYLVNPGDNITLTTTQGTGTAGDTLTVTCVAVSV